MIITPYERYLLGERLTIRLSNTLIDVDMLSNEVIDKVIEKFRSRLHSTWRLSGDKLIDESWIKVLQSIKKNRRKEKLQRICTSNQEIK